jgi:hypothetical protein
MVSPAPSSTDCARGIALAVEQIVPIRTDEYPTRAARPHPWEAALAGVLDEFAGR